MTNILQEAIDLVGGDRAANYGNMFENHQNIAKLWDAYLHNIKTVSPEDVANMMELLKIARRKTGAFNDDDYIDGAGYAAVAHECARVDLPWKCGPITFRDSKFDEDVEPHDLAAENKRLRAGLEEIRDVAQISEGVEWYVMMCQKILEGDTDMRDDDE